MKKLFSAFAICGAMFLTACDSNAGAQNGDTVVIDFAGYKDGVAFDGGTATNFPLVLGSGQFLLAHLPGGSFPYGHCPGRNLRCLLRVRGV